MRRLAALLAWAALVSPCIGQPVSAVYHPGVDVAGHVEKVWYHGLDPHSLCPYGGRLPDGTDDGCLGAPPGGTIYDATFFADAKQSGQGNYYSAPGIVSSHPASWDLPCIDYKCGPDLTHVATLGGSGSGGFRIPGADTLPTGATYSVVTQRVTATPTALTSCPATAQTAAVAAWCILLDGWDFTTSGGMWLRVAAAAGNAAATVIVINNKYADGTFLDQDATANGAGIIQADASGCTALIVTQSEFKRNVVTFPYPLWAYWMDQAGSGACAPPITATYNYFQGTPEHTVRSNSSGLYLNEFNFAQDFGGGVAGSASCATANNCYHASYINIEGTQPTVAAQSAVNNAILSGSTSINGTALISIFIEGVAGGSTITSFTANYNTMISNVTADVRAPGASMGQVLETLPQGSSPTLGVLTLFTAKGNLYDPTGAFGCLFNHAGGSQTDGTSVVTKAYSGGIDLLDGSNGDTSACFGRF